MKKVTSKEVKDKAYPAEKKNLDYLYHHWLYLAIRPISFYITPLFINRNISANTVTLLGILPVTVAIVFNVYGGYSYYGFILGAFFANLWHLFDTVDGNIARFNNEKNSLGGFLDAFIGSLTFVLIPISVGAGLSIAGNNYGILANFFDINPAFYLWISVIWGAAVLLRQNISLLWLHFTKQDENSNTNISTINRLGRAILNYDLPIFFILSLVGWADIWLLFYALFNISTPAGILFLLLRKRPR